MQTILALLILSACSTEQPAKTAAPAKPEVPVITAPEDKTAMVSINATGAKIDPPVEPSQIPEGAWYCDMGTVHWAQMEEGKCGICKMNLTQKATAAEGEDAESEEGEAEGDDAAEAGAEEAETKAADAAEENEPE